MCEYKTSYQENIFSKETKEYKCPHEVYENSKYCIFHYGLNDDDAKGFDVDKVDKKESDFNTSLQTYLNNVKIPEYDFIGWIFPAIFFDKIKAHRQENFIFKYSVKFIKTIFSKEAHFLKAKFEEEANFSNAKFVDEAIFSEAKFVKKAVFSYAKFEKDAGFWKVEFENQAVFSYVNFENQAIFLNVNIKKEAFFQKAKFTNKAYFNDAKFESQAFFPNAKFENEVKFLKVSFADAYFSNAKFNMGAIFSNAKFINKAEFSNASFAEANFSNAEFYLESKFFKTQFKNYAEFSNAKFKNKAEFWKAKFKNKAEFWKTKFENKADFREAEFEKETYFWYAKFENEADFSEATFKNLLTFENSTCKGDIKFNKCDVFKINFNSLKSESIFIFSNSRIDNITIENAKFADIKFNNVTLYEKIEDNCWDFSGEDLSNFSFVECDLSVACFNSSNIQKTHFDSCKFSKDKNNRSILYLKQSTNKEDSNSDEEVNIGEEINSGHKKSKNKEDINSEYEKLQFVYQRFKRHFTENHYYKLAQDFHFQEMKIRKKVTKNILEKIVLWLYNIISRYGTNYWLPLIWLIGWIFFIPILLFCKTWDFNIHNINFELYKQGLTYLFNLISPVKLIDEKDNDFSDIYTEYIKNGSGKTIIVFYYILIITFITLFIQALSRNFKR